MRKTILICFLLASNLNAFGQCDIKTVERPDGNLIRYFNPKPVIIQEQYEVGSAIYKNETSGKFMVNISVLFKTMQPKKVKSNLTIQTNGNRGIVLKLIKSEEIEMNGRKLAVALYEIDKTSLDQLKKYLLKSIFFYLDGHMYGSTITNNKDIFIKELKCF